MTVLAKIRHLFHRKPITEAEVRRREAERFADDQILDTAVEVRNPLLQVREPPAESEDRDLAP